MSTTRPMTRGLAAVALTAGLLAAAAVPAEANPSAAAVCGSPVAGDVNGDGYAEVAIGRGSGQNHQGVNVFSGHRSGLVVDASGTARDDQFLTDRSLADRGATLSSFGSVTGFGDFNGDGCADLAVAAEGGVGVFPGSRLGLVTSTSRRYDLGLLFGANNAFGRSLAVADLDDDGIDDLVVGVPLLDIGTKDSAGGLAVLWGSPDGLNGSRLPTLVTADSLGLPGGARAGDYLGIQLAAGDFDGNGRRDLAVTQENGDFVGTVSVLTYADGAFTAQPALGRATPGVPGEPALDGFGDALAAGDVNGDGRDDLVVASPDRVRDDGTPSVVLLYGTAGGLTGTNSAQFRPGVDGVPATEDPESTFGSAIATGDLDGDGYADLAVGAYWGVVSGQDRAGSVTLLYGSARGMSADRARRLTEATAGIPGKVDEDDEFGCAVGMANLQSPNRSTLLVGACGEQVGKQRGAGMLYQLPPGANGPDTSRASRISSDTPGVKGTAGFFFGFGGSISGASHD